MLYGNQVFLTVVLFAALQCALPRGGSGATRAGRPGESVGPGWRGTVSRLKARGGGSEAPFRRPARLILLAATIGAAGLGAGLLWTVAAHRGAPDDGLTRIAFLSGESGEIAVILHPLATGGAARVVTDQDVIRAAIDHAYFRDDPHAPPEAHGPDTAFVSIIRNHDLARVHHCRAPLCREARDGHRDLAGLLEASLPLEQIAESFSHHHDARNRHWKLMNDPDVVLIEPPNLPAPSAIVYPARLILGLPTIKLGPDATRLPDMAEYRARLSAAFDHAYPDSAAYRLGEITLRQSESDGIALLEPAISVEVIPSLKTRLLGPDAFADMPEFTPILNPSGPSVPLPIPSVDAISVTEAAPVRYTLTHQRIARDEPSAQQ